MSAATSSHSSASDSSSEQWCEPDYVRMLVQNDDTGAVLMAYVDTEWDLPFFDYPESLSDNMDRCCGDLQRFLGIETDDICFTVAVELLGVYGCIGKHEDGRIQLMKVECHIDAFELPAHAAWKDADFVSSLLKAPSCHPHSDRGIALKTGLICMEPGNSIFASLCDPRYQRGWFCRAAEFLASVVRSADAEVRGRVIQKQVSPTSTLLTVQSSEGLFYLKAPALGSNEVSITATVASLFPERTLDVVATCDELNCFVSREFSDAPIEDNDLVEMVQILGRMQLESVQYLDKLRDGGFPDRGPELLAKEIRNWAGSEARRGCGLHRRAFTELAPKLIDMCAQLGEYNIPLTLVHGDFAYRNVSFADASERNMILFDWQYACIGHPFCDFHTLHADIDIPEEALEKYLEMWSSFESMGRIREAYDLARTLGWCAKMWSLLECIDQCNPQQSSSLEDFVYHCSMDAESGVYEWHNNDGNESSDVKEV